MGPSPHEIGGFDRDGVQLNRLRARQGFTGLGPREEKEFIHPPAHLLRGQIHAIQCRAERSGLRGRSIARSLSPRIRVSGVRSWWAA